jgi:dTDP-4-amino-4,6-dideoxygalactose transaminase
MFDAPGTEDINMTDEFYYNSGRTALKHFLLEWRKFNRLEKPVIAMQAFNCRVVADAALHAGYTILLLDSNESDLSINARQLKDSPQKPDVLLLTHYQGIPCIEYNEVSEFCKSNKILLIDDLAQTEGSKIGGIEAGSLSDVWIKSYAFDKPFATWEGGSIKVNTLANDEFQDHFRECCNKLETESEIKAMSDLKKLKSFIVLSDKDKYFRGMRTDSIVKDLLKMGGSGRVTAMGYSKAHRIIKKIYKRTFGVADQMNILKMNDAKIRLAEIQKMNFRPDKLEINSIEELIKNEGGDIINIPGADINWNRYTVIDKSGELRKKFDSSEIEVSNYNWPVPLHKLFKGNRNIIASGNLEVSEYLSANILNIPVWSNYFQGKL